MKNPFRREKSLTGTGAVVETLRERRSNLLIPLGGNTNDQIKAAWLRGQQATYGWTYANTPAVRSVVDYIARNVAQLPLKLYERVDDNERERDTGHPAALTMRDPGAGRTAKQFMFDFVADYLVYGNAYVLKFAPAQRGKLTLIQVPPQWVQVSGGSFMPDVYRVHRTDGSYFDVAPENVIHWRNYNPNDPLIGLSPLETLRSSLAEDAASQAAMVELTKNGLKGGYIKRPLEAPEWSDTARKRFQEDERNQRAASPRLTPVYEEGMEYVPTSMTPKDAQILESRKSTVEEICRLYGVPTECAELIGAGSDRPEARKAFYSDVLPPLTEPLGERFDMDILVAEYAEPDYYFEFDLDEKMRGDPAARLPAITSAVGAPWMSRKEARAMQGLAYIKGTEDLVTPLNVTTGDNPKPAPNVMGPQDPNKPLQDGSHREQPKAIIAGGRLEIAQRKAQLVPHRKADLARQSRYVDESVALMERFYQRQSGALRKAKATFDRERWNRELADDLNALAASIVEREGGIYVARLMGADFDMRQVKNYLRAKAEGAAEGINDVTAADIADLGLDDAMTRARGERAVVAGTSIGATTTVFARIEAAKQAPGYERRVKTWVANTARHAEVDGETVPIDGGFSIGFGPGSAPACACTLSVS